MRIRLFILAGIVSCLLLCQFLSAQTAVTLSSIKQDQKLNGFGAVSLYTNDAGQPMGARFVHDKTGFTLDLLQIESVPQTFIWVNSFPLSGKGEPHTQEHLLITKGNKGRALNTRENMSLAFSNAFTQQLYTAYHFSTSAGGDVFYKLFESYLDALLHPDYTDEEVHREVCNWGVAEDAATKQLKIEEKGSVYNEMKTSMNNPYAQVYNAMGMLLYGKTHPMSYNAGGNPDDIRVLNAADIKKFHDLNYHLGNMGAITALPKTMGLSNVLSEMDKLLNRLQPAAAKNTFNNILPVPQPAPGGTVQMVKYPGASTDPGLMLLAWPAQLTLSATDEIMLNNFLYIFAGDASTNLYKKFIDGKTKEVDLGAQGLYAYADNGQGQPVYIGITDVAAESLSQEKAAASVQKIMEELNRVASFKDGSAELKEFNQRFKNSLTESRRGLAKFINTPPKFGYRNTNENWYQQIKEMEKSTGFKKSIIQKSNFEEIDKLLATGKNFWGAYLEKWKLNNSLPYVVIAKASATLLAEQDSAAKLRAATEVASLEKQFNVTGEQEAISKYKAAYDANTAALEKLEQGSTMKFIDNPPLTLDDQLDFKTTLLANKIPLTASTFNNMTSATTGIALKVNNVEAGKLVYLSMLPELLTQTGILRNHGPVSYEEMLQQQRQEILSLQAYYSTNFKTGRVELVVKGAGNNATEAQRALLWMNDILQTPNWTMQNISRIRDLVDQVLSNKRKAMQGPEEYWVTDPANIYRVQNNPWLMATSSFLTAAHNIHRLRWMLMDAGTPGDRSLSASFLGGLGNIKASRADMNTLLHQLQHANDSAVIAKPLMPETMEAMYVLTIKSRKVIIEAANDLEQMLADIPDESLEADWKYLCSQMAHDLMQTPEQTLRELQKVRQSLLLTAGARMFVVGSGATQRLLKKNIDMLVAGLSTDKPVPVIVTGKKIINERVKKRLNSTEEPVYAGLINPNSATGVFINSAPLVTYADTSNEKLLQFLAAQLFAGGGKQSVYTKTTGAGLSYSTGVSASAGSGLFSYYAERTPLLPQTLGFVIDEIKRTPDDPAMSEYIISLCVSASRASAEYETRGEAMASDIADGLSPALVRRFRQAILKLRATPGLMTEVYKRKDAVYEKILPGYAAAMKDIPGGNYFVIGNEKQMAAYETYLQSKDGPGTKLYRLYPRDYWMVPE
ncbi:MAG: hypothetical protein QM791_02170 [Ferruginibacter sp.]